ncbi:amidinotransferase [Candidatus Francisella endociliophora]|uniref:Amidinotransferase n=1 Tax=Candidatus Francisella endociliophora TaxID=653937 RepID=A0A097EQZ1_9GAMM|nr:arginine deiminase-related protein [Francisella sp. FSC1006]AIT09991.1 amidinotransferase [Francisella sp. FSC1006]
MKEVLMCPPTAFDVIYQINPWMSLSNRPDKKVARSQWDSLYEAYINNGIKVNLIDQHPDLPDMVFTANAGVVHQKTFISAKFISKERTQEEIFFQEWFKNNNYEVKKLNHYQGGEGDALNYNNKLYCGYGYRSDIESHHELAELLNKDVVSIKIVDSKFYDFDLTFCPLGNKAVLYYPGAYDEQSQKIAKDIPNAIQLSHEQASKHLCNSVYVNDKLFMGQHDKELEKKLIKLDIEPVILDISEFRKAGGGLKCLTLKIA